MNDGNARFLDQALVAVGTKGVAGRAEAVAALASLAMAFSGERRQKAEALLESFSLALEFAEMWELLDGFRALVGSPDVEPPAPAAPPPPAQVPAAEQPGQMDMFSWIPPALPESVLADFFAEVSEHLQEISGLVLTVSDPNDESMYELYRKLHTIKGNSGMVGLDHLQEVAHRLEDLVKKLRDSGMPPSDDVRSVLAEGADLSGRLLELAQNGEEALVPVSDFVRSVDRLLAGSSDGVSAAAQDVRVVPVPATSPMETRPAVPVAAPKAPVATAEETDSVRKAGSAVKRMLRVDFGQVDRLALLVGEQAVRQEEVLKQVSKMEESIEEMYRSLDRQEQDDETPRKNLLTYARAASKNLGNLAASLEGSSLALDLVSSDIQRAVLDLRMVPLEALFKKHQMTVFRAATAQGKKARLVVEAAEAKIDKSIAEKLEEPLIHLIRNAVSHGIGDPDARFRAGKPEEGTVTVRSFHQGNQVVIQIEDDGQGISPDVLRAKAVEKGFLTGEESSKLEDHRVVDLIFAAGFSTTNVVDDISGRGVGLDVVRDKINRISGAIEVSSSPGEGTVFQLTLPLTLALGKVLLLEVGDELIALPADNVQRVETITADTCLSVDGKHMVRLEEQTMPLLFLAQALGLSAVQQVRGHYVACIVSHGNATMALVADRVQEHTQAVIRETGEVIPNISHCMGVTIFEGRCVLILDVGSLARQWADTVPSRASDQRPPVVIVADDCDAFSRLAKISLHDDLALAIVSRTQIDHYPLAGAPAVLVHGLVPGLEDVVMKVAAAAPDSPRLVVVERALPAGIALDRLYEAGVADVVVVDSDWERFGARLKRLAYGRSE